MSTQRASLLLVLVSILVCARPAHAEPNGTVVVADYPRYGTDTSPEQTRDLRRFAQAVVAALSTGSQVSVSVYGHADFDPQGRDFELSVSRQRAEAASTKLKELIQEAAIEQALPADRLQSLTYAPPTGLGTQHPVFPHPASEDQRKANRRVEIVWAGTPAAQPIVPAAAACMSRVMGSTPPRSQWAELETIEATMSLSSAIQRLQPLSAATGEINTDFYAITVDAAGQTSESLLSELRSNFNEIVFRGSQGQSVAPYDHDNRVKWESGTYKGATLSFVLNTTLGIATETGAVVVTCTSPTDWVFSTVTTVKDHEHPVSGNRGFGVRANDDGSLTIFTKATDRVVNVLPYSATTGIVFSEGEKVWRHMLDNLAQRYSARHPRDRKQLSLRRAY